MECSTELREEEQSRLRKWAEPKWEKVVEELGQDLGKVARESKALVRGRKIRGAENLLRLVLAYAVCDRSLRLVGAWAAIQKIAEVSDVALLYRFCCCGRWLGILVMRVLQQRNEYLRQLAGVRLRLMDATVISRRGSQGTDWRIHASMDLGKMCLDGVDFTNAHSGESLARFPARADEIWVCDQGYATPKGLGAVLAAAVRLVVRINWQNLPLLLGISYSNPFGPMKPFFS